MRMSRRYLARHPMPLSIAVLAFAVVGLSVVWAGPKDVALPPGPVEIPDMTAAARVDLERNLRWMLDRARSGRASSKARVGVFADAGVWPQGAQSVVRALEQTGETVRVLDRSQIDSAGLTGLKALVLPGGWAPHQRDALGPARLQDLAHWVRGGGHVLGICAGGYLLTKTVRWEKQDFPYPVGLFDGVAEGPVEGLAPWPKMAGVRPSVTDAGRRAGLAAASRADVLYYGGSRFLGAPKGAVLARYPDETAAVIRIKVDKGAVTLSGLHFESAPPAEGATAPPTEPPKHAGALLLRLLGLAAH